MKKSLIFFSALLALGAVSCMENPHPGYPQTNPQQAVMTLDGVTVDFGEATAGDAINLNADKGKTIEVVKVVEAQNLPQGAAVRFNMQVAPTAEFNTLQELEVAKNGTVKADDLDNAFKALYGNDPATKKLAARFIGYVVDGDNTWRLGNEDTYFAAKEFNVTPIDLGLPVESAYYLSVAGNKTKFEHSDKHQYDDPVFTLVADLAAEAEWTIVSESGKTFGVETAGDTSLTGFLKENGKAGKIEEAGTYLITVNMLEGTYEFAGSSNLWTPGNSNGWSHETCQLLYQDGATFYGYAYLDGEFKFTSAANWDSTNYGAGDEEGKLSTDGSAGNLNAGPAGLYWCEVNITELTYKLTPITTIGMIGDFNGWDGDEVLSPNDNFLVWKGTLTLAEAGGWKFRMNEGWDLNLGGTEDNLVQGGPNIASEAGTYDITLDLSKLPYTFQSVAK